MLTLYKEKAPVSGVLFDMDGLVVDTEWMYSRFWMEACRFYGFPMTKEQALQMRSLNHSLGQAKLHEFFGEGADYETIRKKRIALMDAYVLENGVAPKPGIYELLDALDEKHIPRAVTSASPHARIRAYLEPLGLYHRFWRIVTAYDVPHGKPEPDIYLKGAEVLGLAPEKCLALEDSPSGILSASRAGCLSVVIPDQDQPDTDTLSRVYAKADSLADIIGLL